METNSIPTAEAILGTLKAHRTALRAAGIDHLSVFGSVARGEGDAESDIDICVELNEDLKPRGFGRVGQITALRDRLGEIVGRRVDLVIAPVRKPRLRQNIERDGIRAF